MNDTKQQNRENADGESRPVDAVVIRRYRKKPVEIEAVQWMGNSLFDAKEIGKLVGHKIALNGHGQLLIETLEGTMKASKGDFVIKGVKGEIYPCKPDIFEQTYEAV